MNVIDTLLRRSGLVRVSYLYDQLNFARSVGKRLDEHRETVEAIEQRTDLFDDFWRINHLATQDDYLMRLFHLVHGCWPDEAHGGLQKTGSFVRLRPSILGPSRLPEYPHRQEGGPTPPCDNGGTH